MNSQLDLVLSLLAGLIAAGIVYWVWGLFERLGKAPAEKQAEPDTSGSDTNV
jgi:hypothetical protein